MTKVLDFTRSKKQFLTVKLPDAKKTVVMIGTPQKDVFEALVGIMGDLQEVETATNAAEVTEVLDGIYEVCARIMSNNKARKFYSKEDIYALFDLEDVIVFLTGYVEFVEGVVGAKN